MAVLLVPVVEISPAELVGTGAVVVVAVAAIVVTPDKSIRAGVHCAAMSELYRL